MVPDDESPDGLSRQLSDTPLEYFICGTVGGICNTLVGHPFDTIKVHQQIMFKTRSAPRATAIVRQIIANDGFTGLYKGLLVPLLSFHAIYALSFTTYKIGKITIGPKEHELLNGGHYFLAGSFSGFCTSLLQTPGDRIKILMQLQPTEVKKSGALEIVAKLYREGGFSSLYKGAGATFLKEIPANGIYYMTYETLRDALTNRGREKTTAGVAIFSGGSAGVVYAVLVAPLDVVKSRVQAAGINQYPHGIRDAFSDLIRHEGVRGLTRGLGPILLRAFPANAACFGGFEFVRQNIRERRL